MASDQNRIVASLPHGPGNPRNSEGAFIAGRDGRILFAYTRYRGESWSDHAQADIVARTSTDDGRTWDSQDRLLVANDGTQNVMSVSLLRGSDGRLRLFNLRKDGFNACLPCLRVSDDDGLTHPADLVRLPDKRVLLVYGYRHQPFGVRACVSDDGGKTWDVGRELVIAASGVNTDLGYPSVCLADDRHVVVVYYMNGPNTRDRWIECKRIAVEELN